MISGPWPTPRPPDQPGGAPARRISYRESLDFERLHEAAYLEHGFQLIEVAAAPVAERAAFIAAEIAAGG